MLSTLLIIPLITSLIIIITDKISKILELSLISSILNWLLTIIIWIIYDENSGEFQLIERWYILTKYITIGIDGLAVSLILLTTFIVPISLLAVNLKDKLFYIAVLILEMLLIGVFVVLDLIMFYICYEGSLIPMFLLIGIYGTKTLAPKMP